MNIPTLTTPVSQVSTKSVFIIDDGKCTANLTVKHKQLSAISVKSHAEFAKSIPLLTTQAG